MGGVIARWLRSLLTRALGVPPRLDWRNTTPRAVAQRIRDMPYARISYVCAKGVHSIREIKPAPGRPRTTRAGRLTFQAYCYLVKETRTFRVDRVEGLMSTQDPNDVSRTARFLRWCGRKRSALVVLWNA